MDITIRKAQYSDREEILYLLKQIAEYHQAGRHDIFRANSAKYTQEEFATMLQDESKPVFVAVSEDNAVMGYVFCNIIVRKAHPVLNDFTSLYIDDFCVDKSMRGNHIGKQLFEHVKNYANEIGVQSITLNVWEFNESARLFYESCGMTTQRRIMEMTL